MKTYLVKRLLSLIPILFVVSIVVYSIIYITPGDPAEVMLGDSATEEQVEALREELGLNQSFIERYFTWVGHAVTGDLGTSYFMNEGVTSAIISHLFPTLSLAILAELFAIIIGIPIGIFAARRRGSYVDQSIMGLSYVGVAIPSFLLALFLVLIFSIKLQWLPVAGYKDLSEGLMVHLEYMILPAIALGLMHVALTARMTRSSMLDVLNANFIKTARAKGVKEAVVIYRHTFRNALLPIITIVGQNFGILIAGAAVVETVFNIPGIGQLVVNSIERRDFPIIQGVILFVTFVYVLINLIVDLLYGVIDPRVKLNK